MPALTGLLESESLHALAHITGGGLTDNIPRVLPEGTSVELDRTTWNQPAIFGLLQRLGNVPARELLRTFNCGIGMTLICAVEARDQIIDHLTRHGEQPQVIGRVIAGDRTVHYK